MSADLTHYFTPQDIQRGADWARTSSLADIAELLIDLAILTAFSIGPPGRWLWNRLAAKLTRSTAPLDRLLGSDWRTGAVFLGSVSLLRNVATFPIFLYVQFFVARRIGLLHESIGTFLRQTILATFIVVAATALLGGMIGVVRSRWPNRWWLTIGVSAALLLTAQAALEPMRLRLHYKIEPLAAGPLRTRIESLAQSLHADIGPVMTLDESHHGSEANAWVSGFGPTHQLIVTDTLIGYGDEAVIGAVAHEIGHRREERMPMRLAIAGLGMIGLLWLIERTLRFAARHGAPHSAQGLPLVKVLTAIVLLTISPLRNSWSRDEEREADAVEFSVRRDYDAYIAEQVRLVRSNASQPEPYPALAPFMTHPSPMERIESALEYKEAPIPSRPLGDPPFPIGKGSLRVPNDQDRQ